jgi:acetoacetate decarboxylase
MALVPHVDYGGLVSVPTPFLCRNADVWNFFVKADGDKLDALCKRVFYDPSGGAVEYVALGDHVMLAWGVVDSAESLWPEPTPPAGVPWNQRGGVQEPQVCVWVPAAQVKREGTKRVATKFAWFMPYIWVDNAMSLATGRETLGYPKTFGRFGFPEPGQPREWTLEAFGLDYAPQNKACYHPIMEVKQTGGFTDTIDQGIDNVIDLARALADQVFGTRDPGEVRPGISFYLDSFKNTLQGRMYQVFLKQIRSAEAGLGAALQQVVEARYDITDVHGFPHPAPAEFEFTVRQIDSHPVIHDLGLYDQEVVAAINVQMNFEVTNGTVLWDSHI